MLHTGILPHHTKWMRLFEKLRYIVLDELHTYRGVFGSHLANVLRRLRRVANFYGSDPQFICCSATIANPGELASQLIEKEVEVVEENGAPAGEKLFVFYNPPMVNRNLGIRRSYINEATRVAKEILGRKLQTIVFANSRLHNEVILTYLQQANPPKSGQPEPVRGYRGGYLPGERREIERGLRDGRILGVVATNALELGIDVGSLDACVMAGYPGSIASTWQRAGRAGRRTGSSCAVFVASSAPLDQFIVKHPDYFFGSSPEHAHVQPDNLEILVNHLKCAAFELPISPDEGFGKVDLPGLCEQLGEAGFLHQSGGDWHWIDEAYPADTISLRSVTSDNFVIIDTTGEEDGNPAVRILLGNGDGTFQSARTFVQNIFPGRLTAGDFNQDRLADIFTANQGTTIGVVTNTSARTGADVAANIFTGGTVQDLIYWVVASNRCPRAATNGVITDLAPANSFFVSASNTQGTCSQTGSSITCDFGSLAAGAFAFAQIQVVTPPPPFSVTDSATVTANEFDPNTKNNIATNTFKYP